jgi:hypothetical protein
MLRRSLLALSFAVIPACCLLSPRALRAAKHTPPPAGPASSYPDHDSHPQEHVTIAADPYDTKAKASVFRADYLKYGILPIRIIVTNEGDRPVSLADARIDFITAAGDKAPAAEPEDVERRIDHIKRPDSGFKLPGPLPRIGSNPEGKQNKAIEADFNLLEYSAVKVAPHSTQSGFLFYDLSGVADPLVGGRLELRTLRDAAGKELFAFEIPFGGRGSGGDRESTGAAVGAEPPGETR